MIYLQDHPTGPQRGWLKRYQDAIARLAAAKAPKGVALARVRAAMADLADAKALARTEFDRQAALVPVPLPERINRDVAVLIERTLAEVGVTDPTRPLSAGPTFADIERNMVAAAQSAYDKASQELARIEAQEIKFAEIVSAGPGAVVLLDGPDDSEPVEELPRRRPGRPRLSDED